MEVSIIIPYKNYINYLRECLKSINAQSFKNYEVIITYHESAQKDMDLIQSEFDFDKRSFINCGESNVSIARNKGISEAKGKYICFLDSDDYFLPDTLETWMNHINDSTMKIDILFGLINQSALKYESFLIDFYEYKTSFQTNKNLDIVIKDKSQLVGTKFDSKTVLGKLFRREFILSRRLLFDEKLNAYSELPFILSALEMRPKVSGTKETKYVKRSHDDVISMPSLIQELGNRKAIALGEAYLSTNKNLSRHSQVKKAFDQFMCEYFWNETVRHLAQERSDEIRKDIFEMLSEIVLGINDEIFSDLPRKQKKFFKQLKQKKYESCLKYVKFVMQIVDLKAGLKSKMAFKKYLYNNWLIKLKPKKKTIVFESYLGRQYSCNPKAIYEYMKIYHPEYQLYWSIDSQYHTNFKQLETLERFSLKWFWKMARSEYWVFNSRLPLSISKPKGTTYLQTWHGTPLKKLVFDVEEIHMPGTTTEKYKQNFYIESRNWDYLISPNEYSTQIFQRAFRFEKDMLEYGYPRNDVLSNGNNRANIEHLKRDLGIPIDKKVILYAPTFRDNQFYKTGNYKFDLPMDLKKLKKQYGESCVFLLRMHYLIAENFDLKNYKGFAYDFSNKADINDLYLVSDLLITDYSSVFFDFANLKRPIAFYTYDLAEYRETLRGFYFNLEKKAPGPLIKNEKELIEILDEFLKLGEFKAYQEAYNTFYNKYCNLNDGNATRRTVENVFLN